MDNNKLDINTKDVFENYLNNANFGDVDAQHTVGYLYSIGYGVEQNYEEAIKWFKLAAENGNASSYFQLGQMYFEGVGVEQNYDISIEHLKKASELNSSDAMYTLGLIYLEGEIAKQDINQGIKYLLDASKLENFLAEEELGLMFLYGKHVEEDSVVGMDWLIRSAKHGHNHALFEAYYYRLNKFESRGITAGANYNKCIEGMKKVARHNVEEAQEYLKNKNITW